MHFPLQNQQTLAAELFLKCIINSFTGSLKIHFYTDLFLDEGALTK